MLVIDNININNKKMFAISNLTTTGKQLIKICENLEQAKNEKIYRIINWLIILLHTKANTKQ